MFDYRNVDPEEHLHSTHSPYSSLVAVTVIVIFFIFFFGPTLLTGKFLIAGDAYYQSYPLRTIAWAAIRRGELPLWTSGIFSGYPLLSMAQVALGYPLTWVYLVLPGPWAEQIVVLAPFLLAPTFTYLYAREVGLSHFAALLAGLTFTYAGNMSSKLGGLGLMANAESWLPLFLLALERCCRRRFPGPLLLATGAYTMSILAGQAQAFLLVGMVGLAYGLFLPLFVRTTSNRSFFISSTLTRWRCFAVAIASIALATGVAAFQILETLPVAKQSIRSSLSFEIFTAGSFSATEAIQSLLAPVHHYIEVSTYVAPAAVLLALYGCLQIFKRDRERRIVFWSVIAATAFFLMLGANTPLFRALYHVPIFNLFRYPSRHSFEWTFALSMLAAYGADALVDVIGRRRKEVMRNNSLIAWSLFVAGVVVAVLWWRSALLRPLEANFGLDSGLIPAQSERNYLLWKLGFTSLMLPLFWYALTALSKDHSNQLLPICAIALALFVEPQIFFGHVWFPFAKTKDAFTTTPPIEQWLQKEQEIERQRVYTRVNLFTYGYWAPPPLDLPNMTLVRGLENVAGYEQLIPDRYSRALGDAGPDAVNKRYGLTGPPDETLFTERSHVLDLLNTRHVVTFTHLRTSPEELIDKEGIGFAKTELSRELMPGQTALLSSENATGDTLALVTALSASVEVNQNAPVAHLRVISSDKKVVETDLLAGRDTAEWAHDRADVQGVVKHKLATVFDSHPGDSEHSFLAYRYWSTLPLGSAMSVSQVQITNVAKEARLALWKATIFDSAQGKSATLALDSGLPATQWRVVRNQEGVVVWENERALPRAWVVPKLESVDAEEALRRIRGTSQASFDPRQTALVEVPADQLPALIGAEAVVSGSARVTKYAPNSLSIEAHVSSPAFLVVSEIFYPGWKASIDGQPTKILPTDYLLRGVPLPAGRHTIEMYYSAPGAFKGLIVSVFSLLIVGGLLIYSRLT